LLIPHIFECLPQRIDHESFLLALHMAAEAANPYFRLGYNSLGAFATINHLHFQVLDIDSLSYYISEYLEIIATVMVLLIIPLLIIVLFRTFGNPIGIC
jgi:hypothetical protein